MKTTENNKLIEEFMGADLLYMVVDVDKQRGDMVLSTGLSLEDVYREKSHFDDRFNIDSSIKSYTPKYDTCFDDLMPVLEQIKVEFDELGIDLFSGEFEDEVYGIEDAIWKDNIGLLYSRACQLIEFINKKKKS